MILYLCEKPSQARDIARILGVRTKRGGYLEGSDTTVTWCLGHLLEMVMPDGYKDEWKAWHLETLPIIPDKWQLEVRKAVSGQFKIIKGLVKQAQSVVLATDADREGETIGREVLERCGYHGQISRLWLSALDDASIQKALHALLPGEKTQALYQAGIGRARADWLVGMNLSRAYTVLGRQGGYSGVLSVGRVQTPTLKLVVDRDRQIENFKPVAFFDVFVILQVENGQFKAKWIPAKSVADEEGRCLDQNVAIAVVEKVTGQTGNIHKAQTKRVKEPPPLPLELSTLQQEASKRWGMSAQGTLDCAQALYEKHKALTYPRTDCRYLPNSQFGAASNVLQAMAQSDSALSSLIAQADTKIRSKAWNDKKITAHHAIIPTCAIVNVTRMSSAEMQLYDLVRRYYLAQFFPAFEYDQTTIETKVAQEIFRATGRVEVNSGWKRVLGNATKTAKADAESLLPLVKKGETADVIRATVEQKKTNPPNRFTEGTLIFAMKTVGKMVADPRLKKILRETAGIGTEATRAAIINTLLNRNLLTKAKKNLISMPAGRQLVDNLPHSVTDPSTTAVWEQSLDDIATGHGTLDEFLGKSVTWITRLVANVKARAASGTYVFAGLETISATQPQTSGKTTPHACPQCGQAMLRRNGANGGFWGCSSYPRCNGTLPDSNNSHDKAAAQSQKLTDTACPQCKTGYLVKRAAKKGKQSGQHFFGCSCFPKCRYTSPL